MFDPVEDYQKTILNKARLIKKKSSVVLDLGCGRGDNALELAKKYIRVVGIDKEGVFRLPKRKIKNLSLIKADAGSLPFKDSTFDMIFTKDTLHHIHNLGLAFSEMKRVLRPGGKLIIVECNRYNPVFYIHMTKMEKHNHYSGGYLKMLIEEHGFITTDRFHVESRVYPIRSVFLHHVAHILEQCIEKIPIINLFSSYNVLHAKVSQK